MNATPRPVFVAMPPLQPLKPFRENRSRKRPAVLRELSAQLNLGPKSAAWLHAAGIRPRDDVARLGPIETCRRMRAAGQPVSVLLAYALEGALAGCHWNALPWATKQFHRTQFAQMKRGWRPRLTPRSGATSS